MSGSTLTGILIAVFSVGGAAVIGTLIKGIDGWRAGVARKEARAIENLEKYRDDADWRATVADHRTAYQSDLADYWRARAGNAEHQIRITQGEEAIPPSGPLPQYVPLIRPTESRAVEKVTDDA